MVFDYFYIVYDYSFIIQLLAVSVSVALLMRGYEKSVKGVLIFVAHVAGLFVAETLVNWLMFVLSYYVRGLQGINFPLCHFIVVLVYTAFFSVYPLCNRLILSSTIFASTILLSELGAQVVRMSITEVSRRAWLAIPFYAAVIAFAVLMKKISLNEYYEVTVHTTALVLTINIAAMAVEISYLLLNRQTQGNMFFCFVLVVCFVICVSGYLMAYFHCRERDENVRLQVENKLLESDKKMMQLSDRALEEMRELRHDMRNQYMVMGVMLREGRYDELSAYFESMKAELAQYPSSVNSGNSVIDSVMNMELLKAAANGVTINYRIRVPSALSIASSDLCRMIANLTDNAVEGVLRNGAGDLSVDCTIEADNGYLYICLQNAVGEGIEKERLLKFDTWKPDYKNHGYGHKIVKKIVEKYKGHCNYTVEDGVFIAEAMLELKMGE